MKDSFARSFTSRALARAGQITGTLSLLLWLPAWGTVLDDFSGAKTGWTDTLNSGTVNQAGGLFTIATANNTGALTYSRKTSVSFTNLDGHTIEFRADVVVASPGSPSVLPQAMLAWVPSGGAVLGNGYCLAVNAGNISLLKGASVLYSMNYAAAGTNVQNTNITMVLRLSTAGSAVSVNGRVYRRISNGVIGQYFTTLFEYTAQDASGLVGQAGNVALGVKNLGSAAGASVAFARLQGFDTTNMLLDNFDSNPTLSGWTMFRKNPGIGDSVTVNGGQLDVVATIADAKGGFAGIYTANQTFKIVDGGRVEFQLDVVENFGLNNSYSALGYLPIADPAYIYGLVFYHIAHDYVTHTTVVSGKGYNEWWGGRNDIQPPVFSPGSRYTLIMTGEGNNCRVESRIEDLSVTDINDAARVVWQSEFVDTPAADAGLNEASLANPLPYLNVDGRFTIATFNSGAMPPNWAHVLYDNAVVRRTVPPRSAPILANVGPAFGANFLAATNVVVFDATGGTNLPLTGLAVTLNGIRYTNGSAGVAITPTSASSTSRHFSLTGALVDNVNYVGTVEATDAYGLTATSTLRFDTFLTNDFVVESEEYNFSADGGTTGGSFIDNPILVPEYSSDPNSYMAQPGLAEVDFHDNRSFWGGGWDANHTFRSQDSVYTSHCSDTARAKYVNAGGIAAGYYETEVGDIYDGDWLNYTRHYPAGTYNILLRQAIAQIQNSLVTLERVTSDRTVPNQTTAVLGSFAAKPSGIGLFVNVPLTDATGAPMILRFSGGIDTLRVMNRNTGNADLDVGNLEQNYLIFAPVADPGLLRPAVAMATPAANTTLNSVYPSISAAIVNRDTTVDTGSIVLAINGQTVQPTTTATSSGAQVNYNLTAPLPPADSTVTNTLIFRDNTGVYQTNTWTWVLAYPWLRAANSLPLGSLNVRGFEVRTVQTDNGGVNLDNSLLRARQQLAIPPEIQVDVTATSIVQTLNWNQSGSPANVPGLCPAGEIKNIAAEAFGYLELTAGPHRFHVVTDDRAGWYSGAGFKDSSPIVLWEASGNTANTTFDFVVEADGLYPVRCLWEQAGGGAVLSVTATNVSTGTEVLLNDPDNPATAIKAWYPLVCRSSVSVTGPFTPDGTAVNVPKLVDNLCNETAINQMVTGGTLTIPQSGATRFYRLDGPRSTQFTGIKRVGSNIVITYQVR